MSPVRRHRLFAGAGVIVDDEFNIIRVHLSINLRAFSPGSTAGRRRPEPKALSRRRTVGNGDLEAGQGDEVAVVFGGLVKSARIHLVKIKNKSHHKSAVSSDKQWQYAGQERKVKVYIVGT